MKTQAARVTGQGLWCAVDGVFYRSVSFAFRDMALAGSREPGRYSSASQPSLYLSASPEGVAAAMIAHASTDRRTTRAFHVHATHIADLRAPEFLSAAGIDAADAMADWQPIVAAGGRPKSWDIRDRLEDMGAAGLIDPSRKRPGLWHLVLFRWNIDGGAPVVAATT